MTRKPDADYDIREIERLWESGFSWRGIANKKGWTYQNMMSWMKRNYPIMKSGRWVRFFKKDGTRDE